MSENELKLREEVSHKREELNKTKEALDMTKNELESLKKEFLQLKNKHQRLHGRVKTMTEQTELLRKSIAVDEIPLGLDEEKKSEENLPESESEVDEVEYGTEENKNEISFFSQQGYQVLFVNLVQLMFWLILLCYYIAYLCSSPYLWSPFEARSVFSILLIICLAATVFVGVVNVIIGFIYGIYSLKRDHERGTLYSLISVVISVLTLAATVVMLLTSFIMVCESLANDLNPDAVETDVLFLITHLCFFLFCIVASFWLCYSINKFKSEYKLLQDQITVFFDKHM